MARACLALALRQRGLSYPVIGRQLGGRDHSTIIHLIQQAPSYAKAPGYEDEWAAIKNFVELNAHMGVS